MLSQKLANTLQNHSGNGNGEKLDVFHDFRSSFQIKLTPNALQQFEYKIMAKFYRNRFFLTE